MSTFLRVPLHRYEDPLALVWTSCAERVGFRIGRSSNAYASTDGRGTIFIGTDDILDPDDSLAQMIFHELCHALVEGEEGERLPDWGLDNISARHTWREHACLRLQAYLASSVGLRDFLAPTTDFRVSFWNTLPEDPMAAPAEAGGRRERSCVAARLAIWRASQPRWLPHLQAALGASAVIARVAASAATERAPSKVHGTLPSLYETVDSSLVRHPAGHSFIAPWHKNEHCGTCAWHYQIRSGMRCRHAPRIKLADNTVACARWEAAHELECQTCGACCREAYDSVELARRDPFIKRHPSLVVFESTHLKIKRDGDHCAALTGGHSSADYYACNIYSDRPKTCREFTRGSEHCLTARRKVGLSL